MTSSVPLTPDVEGGRGTTSQGAGGLIDRHRRAILAGIVVLGMALRTRGFSSGTLFRDDSWVALSARMSARSAWSLVTAAPGDLYFFRTWVSINPSTLWWAQIPSFLAGTAGILAIYLLVRRFGFASWVALFAALVLATAVMPAVFSTHLKPYVFDLLWTCLLIALEETARHTSRARPTITFALVAIVATWSGFRSPSSRAEIWLLALRRLKNSFFWFAVVPIFTSDHERRIYSWIAARIHHIA